MPIKSTKTKRELLKTLRTIYGRTIVENKGTRINPQNWQLFGIPLTEGKLLKMHTMCKFGTPTLDNAPISTICIMTSVLHKSPPFLPRFSSEFRVLKPANPLKPLRLHPHRTTMTLGGRKDPRIMTFPREIITARYISGNGRTPERR